MEYSTDFQFLCRICAHNSKNKNSSYDGVYIFSTPNLQEKIKRYLDITITKEDPLPKVLCKKCYRTIYAVDSLTKIGLRTQNALQNLLTTNLESGDMLREFPVITKEVNPAEPILLAPTNNASTTEPPRAETAVETSPAVAAADDDVISETLLETFMKTFINGAAHAVKPAIDPYLKTVKMPQPRIITKELMDSIIQSTEKTMFASAAAAKTALPAELNGGNQAKKDNNAAAAKPMRRTSMDMRFAPKSIAQRSMTTKATAEPLATAKKSSPPAVINFFGNKTAQPIIVSAAAAATAAVCNSNSNAEAKDVTAMSSKETNSKLERKFIRKALSNLKPVNPGQVSLLKTSQKPATAAAAVEQLADAANILPERPILANPKVMKQQIAAATTTTATTTAITTITTTATTTTTATAIETAARKSLTPPMSAAAADAQIKSNLAFVSKCVFADDLTLGKVIKDTELQKLILKTLKWELNEKNYETQLTRLKETPFKNIMNNEILWQDADLKQLLNSYLAPLRQGQMMAQNSKTSTTSPLTKVLAMSYKLPPETSVQLVPASPERDENVSGKAINLSNNKRGEMKRARRIIKTKSKTEVNLIEISDDNDDEVDEQRKTTKTVKANDSLTTLLEMKEHNMRALARQQRMKLSTADGNANLVANASEPLPAFLNIDNLWQGITPRPIIKRRKVAKQAANTTTAVSTDTTSTTTTTTAASAAIIESANSAVPNAIGEPTATADLSEQTTVAVPTTTAVFDISGDEELPVCSKNASATAIAGSNSSNNSSIPLKTSQSNSNAKNRRCNSILGQELLAAIGSTAETMNESAAKQEIRAAMRSSLKMKQEQNRQKEQETVDETVGNQVADSSTKLTADQSMNLTPSDQFILSIAQEFRNELAAKDLQESNCHGKNVTAIIGDGIKRGRRRESDTVSTASSHEIIAATDAAISKRPKRGRKSKLELMQMQQERDNAAGNVSGAADSGDESEPLANLRLDSSKSSLGSSYSKRPQRVSKTLSKYYKSPIKSSVVRSSSQRSTRSGRL